MIRTTLFALTALSALALAQGASAAPNPHFAGFRTAPSTPAHAPGLTARQLSSTGADFDGDGCEDVATFQITHLTFMKGDCHGGFTRVQSQSTATNVYHPVHVDLNHDGYPDIVAMTFPFAYSGTVISLLNQKNGTFSAPTVISKKASVYSGLQSMNVYDINGDGNQDVIIAGLGTQDTMVNSSLVFEVVLGNADGSFAAPLETLGTFPYKPTFAFDGGTALRVFDGQLYLYAVAIQSHRVNGTSFGSELLVRWAVNANGTVDAANPQINELPIFSSSPNKYLQFADLDADGVDDATLLNGDGMLYSALGTSDGGFATFGFALPASDGNNAAVVKFRDVDGDGKVDAIIAGGQYLGVWPGKGDGTFRAPGTTYVGGYAINSTSGLTFPVSNHVIDDFDTDGIDDVAFFDTSKRALLFHRGKADGSFVGAPALTNPHGNFATNGLRIIATTDLNADGEPDIVVNSPWAILSGLNDHRGGFTYRALSPNQAVTSLSPVTADFNQDGKADLVFLGQDQDGYIHLYIGFSKGDGTVDAVAQRLPFTSAYAPAISIGDINGDGAPDLVLAHNNYIGPAYGVWPMVNDGKGTLTAGSFINRGVQLFAASLADANGDGKADLFLSYGSYTATTTAVYLADGNGSFTAVPSATLQNTQVVAGILAKDVTGDGVVDAVLSVTFGTGAVLLYAGRGDGTFEAGVALTTGVFPAYLGATDLNGDELPDIYFSNTEAVLTDAVDGLLGLTVLRGTGNNSFAAPVSYPVQGAASPILPFDPLHTGSPNLLAGVSGATAILINNGASRLSVAASATTIATTGAATLTVEVARAFADQPLPTGTVALVIDGDAVDHTPLRADGTATFTVSALTAGTHALSATYEGDGNYNVNLHANTVSLVVSDATPRFLLSSDAAMLSLSAGGSASTTLSLAANPAFSGPVTLACSGAPLGATCGFSQASVMLAPGQTVQSTLTLETARSTAVGAAGPTSGLTSGPTSGPVIGAMLCALVLASQLFQRRHAFARRALAVVATAGMLTAAACSESDSEPSVSAGTYVVSVTATPADASVAPQTVAVVIVIPSP